MATFKAYSPTRVVLEGEPNRTPEELLFAGAFDNPPPIANYTAGAELWDRGSQVWLTKRNTSDTTWSEFSGPVGYHTGSVYATRGQALRHLTQANAFGHEFIVGVGANQVVEKVVAFTAASADDWQWDPIGTTIGDISNAIDGHNNSSSAHPDIRAIIAALQAATGLTIAACDADATYSRGSSNSVVTHGTGLYAYISGQERNADHDPGQHPELWMNLVRGVESLVVGAGSHRFRTHTLVLQRRFREGCGVMPAWRLGAWRGSAWPVRCCPAYPPATAATLQVRTVPGAASPAPPGRPAAS